MDYVPSASLSEIARAARGSLQPRVATAIAAGALRGLHAVHEVRASVVPRVLSSDRVLVGEDRQARVLHFDVESFPDVRAALDDLPYAAPEQVLGDGVDVRRDVFAASVLLWQTLTGRALFTAPTVHGVLQMIACASHEEVARALAEMDLPCVRWRNSLADAVTRRESASLQLMRKAVLTKA